MKLSTTHIIVALKEQLNGKKLTSIDSVASNRNQYFGTIKKQGIELIEVWENNRFNAGKHKARRLNPTDENIKRAEQYLNRLSGKISIQNEETGSN